ncbi:MAG: RluA family pseudouridine synthase [Flavobacteriales bacterium]
MVEVLYEDNHLIAINKASSDLVQGDKTGDETLADRVKEFLRVKYNKPGAAYLGITHRIDRPVTGIVLFAKTSKALARMNQMFQDKTIQKTYWAIVVQEPPQKDDELRNYLVKNSEKNKSFAFKQEIKNSKLAILTYKWLATEGKQTLLEVSPKTGRHHQIRVQLSKIGCIIQGDTKYGAPSPNKDRSICLHARYLDFTHPVSNEKIRIEAPVPNNVYWQAFAGA